MLPEERSPGGGWPETLVRALAAGPPHNRKQVALAIIDCDKKYVYNLCVEMRVNQ